jgi:hypothetical protein
VSNLSLSGAEPVPVKYIWLHRSPSRIVLKFDIWHDKMLIIFKQTIPNTIALCGFIITLRLFQGLGFREKALRTSNITK